MAIETLISGYTPAIESKGEWYIIQVNLTGNNIKEVKNVYAKDNNDLGIIVEYTQVEGIEETLKTMVDGNDTTNAYFQYQNDVLSLLSSYTLIPTTYSFYFTSTRLSQPMKSLDDDIDIPDSLVPLFVNKVLANIYHLQGKEVPITIKRKIKELE